MNVTEETESSHNSRRSRHPNTNPLSWDANMAQEADAYCNELIKLGKLKHASNEDRNGDGENLYWSQNSQAATIEDASKSW